MKNASSKSGILWLSASKCKIWLMSTKCNILAIQFCVQNYFNFQKKIKFHKFGPKNTMVKNLSRKPKTKSPGYKFHPCMGIFQLPPSKCPCKDFSISLFLHPNNLCFRMRMKFFQNLKFRVYNAMSLLAIGVRKWHGIIDTEIICLPCQFVTFAIYRKYSPPGRCLKFCWLLICYHSNRMHYVSHEALLLC